MFLSKMCKKNVKRPCSRQPPVDPAPVTWQPSAAVPNHGLVARSPQVPNVESKGTAFLRPFTTSRRNWDSTLDILPQCSTCTLRLISYLDRAQCLNRRRSQRMCGRAYIVITICISNDHFIDRASTNDLSSSRRNRRFTSGPK